MNDFEKAIWRLVASWMMVAFCLGYIAGGLAMKYGFLR